uniref:Uncharacterized protein n=1 Tax=Mus musculus TaxID=10090 RepID=Q3TX10_MOUSE|nr:unnamed protein product [Mus musculus]BAE35106.1 unnamed protein product [Mus musculus]
MPRMGLVLRRKEKCVPVLLRRRRGVTGEPFSMRVRATNHVCTSWSNGTVCETCISFDSFQPCCVYADLPRSV